MGNPFSTSILEKEKTEKMLNERTILDEFTLKPRQNVEVMADVGTSNPTSKLHEEDNFKTSKEHLVVSMERSSRAEHMKEVA